MHQLFKAINNIFKVNLNRNFEFNLKTKNNMGIIEDKRKFKRKVEQTNPTNPTGKTDIKTNEFDIDEKTIKDQQNKS